MPIDLRQAAKTDSISASRDAAAVGGSLGISGKAHNGKFEVVCQWVYQIQEVGA